MSSLEKKVEKILLEVTKPTRYLGHELNSARKDHAKTAVKVLLAFPDVYEVGMSHLGLKILYDEINKEKDKLAERTYAPWLDMEEIMRREDIPLFSLESKMPAKSFDVIGFTLQYELSYTNILNMLSLAGIPLKAAERGEDCPLVIGGGPGAFNPEPLAPFFDLFLLGEGEEVFRRLLDNYAAHLKDGGGREAFLLAAAQIKGCYVPSLYRDIYSEGGDFLKTTPVREGVPSRIGKVFVRNLDQAHFPEKYLVPYMDIVHDRIMLELFRGCTRGCRFCQAGMIYRPLRERSLAVLKELTLKLVENSGYEEVSLSSLSTGDYPEIKKLLQELSEATKDLKVNFSLPSLRIDNFSLELARQVQKIRKSSLTFAPEAGTQRLRNVINKTIEEKDILLTLEEAFRSGWQNIKLYFMIGLPTETSADLEGIAVLSKRLSSMGKAIAGGRVRITVNTSTFVPKPHTPFQWVRQINKKEMQEKQAFLRKQLQNKSIKYTWHDPESSYLEGVLSRGDRRLAGVILRAFELGCKFDSWREQFAPEKWQQAFTDTGIDPDYYTAARDVKAPLPWDHLDSGVAKKYLAREYRKALAEETTPDCRQGCLGCGITAAEVNSPCGLG